MPPDSRRISGPEKTIPPIVYMKCEEQRLVDASKTRKDKRSLDKLRPISLKVGVISQARGSAYLEMNKTKIICSVYGPRETHRGQSFSSNGQLYCEFKFAPYSCPVRRQYQPDAEEKELSNFLHDALQPVICMHKFPKATVDVFVMVLENDGGVIAGAVTCAGVALADAGIDMYDMVIGCSLRQYGEHMLIDPTRDEEVIVQDKNSEVDHGCMTLALMPSIQQVASIMQYGELQVATVSKGIKALVDACHQIYPLVQQCLLKSVKEKVKNNEGEESAPATLSPLPSKASCVSVA